MMHAKNILYSTPTLLFQGQTLSIPYSRVSMTQKPCLNGLRSRRSYRRSTPLKRAGRIHCQPCFAACCRASGISSRMCSERRTCIGIGCFGRFVTLNSMVMYQRPPHLGGFAHSWLSRISGVACSSQATRDQLARIDDQVQRKAERGKPLSREDLQRNKNIAVPGREQSDPLPPTNGTTVWREHD